MASSKFTYDQAPEGESLRLNESSIEDIFIDKLRDLKYGYRPDITNRAALEQNFREKFEALNRVHLTDAEFARLLDEIVTPDVFTASKTLRAITSFTRDDGTPLNYSLVNLKDWCNGAEPPHFRRDAAGIMGFPAGVDAVEAEGLSGSSGQNG